MWLCPCGQENEPQFDNCWQCETDAPPVEERQRPSPVPAPAPPSPPTPRPLSTLFLRTFLDCFLALILPFVATPASFPGGDAPAVRFTAILLIYPSILGVAIWRRRRMVQANEPVAPLWPESWSLAIVGGVAIGLLSSAMGWIYVTVSNSGPDGTRVSWSALEWAIRIGLAVVTAPLCEEALFRGSILGSFSAAGRTGWGMTVSSLLFAAAHLSLGRLPYFFAMGLLFGWTFLKTRSIAGSIVAHAVHNTVCFVLFAWDPSPISGS